MFVGVHREPPKELRVDDVPSDAPEASSLRTPPKLLCDAM
jgi:hypothetical protein